MKSLHARDQLLHALHTRGPAPAFVIDGAATTWAALLDEARRCAAGLQARGVGAGDVVATLMSTRREAIVGLVAHHLLGAVHAPVNPKYRSDELAHVLVDAGAKVLVVEATTDAAQVLAATPRPTTLERVVRVGDATPPSWPSAWSTEPWADLVAAAPPAGWPIPAVDDEATALLVYTSGTTGRSKGVELSFRALVSSIAALSGLWHVTDRDVIVHALPLFHVHGLCVALHGALLRGATTLFVPKFSADAVVEAIDDGGTVFMGVPTMYARILEHLQARPHDAVILQMARLFTAGSAPLSAADHAAFLQATGHRVLERYGMTETLITLSNPYEGARKPGSVGLPVPGYDVEVQDDAGAPCAPGVDGEVVVRGAGLMTRYRGQPAATAASFRDGWFLTGDVGHVDEDGYFFLIGRKSTDVLKSGGYKISAREIEEALASLPFVAELSVVGVPDRTWGQRVVAVVVPQGETAAQAQARHEAHWATLTAAAATKLADYKRPRELVFVDALPRNAMGKVQKAKLVERIG